MTTNKDTAAAAKNNGTSNAFKYFLQQLGKTTLVSAAIFTFVMFVLNVAFNYFGVSSGGDIEWLTYPAILQLSIPYFMLVLGIIMPCYMELLLGYGITRRQQSVGLLGATAVISIATALAYAILLVFAGEFSLSQSAGQVLSNWYYFLFGWVIVLGYLYRRVFAAIASTLAGIALLGFWPLGNPWIYGGATSLTAEINSVLLLVLSIVVSLLVPVVVVVLTRRISIKI